MRVGRAAGVGSDGSKWPRTDDQPMSADCSGSLGDYWTHLEVPGGESALAVATSPTENDLLAKYGIVHAPSSALPQEITLQNGMSVTVAAPIPKGADYGDYPWMEGGRITTEHLKCGSGPIELITAKEFFKNAWVEFKRERRTWIGEPQWQPVTNAKPADKSPKRPGPEPHWKREQREQKSSGGVHSEPRGHSRGKSKFQRHQGRGRPLGNDLILSFGKHKGRRLTEVQEEDPGYYRWIMENVAWFAKLAHQKGFS